MLIQQTLIQYLLQKKNLCEIFKVLTIWGNINLFIRPQHHYLRVTEEQYEELIKGLYEARKTAEKHQVPFSYFFDSEA